MVRRQLPPEANAWEPPYLIYRPYWLMGYTFTGLGGVLLVVELTLAQRRRRSPGVSPTAVSVEPAA